MLTRRRIQPLALHHAPLPTSRTGKPVLRTYHEKDVHDEKAIPHIPHSQYCASVVIVLPYRSRSSFDSFADDEKKRPHNPFIYPHLCVGMKTVGVRSVVGAAIHRSVENIRAAAIHRSIENLRSAAIHRSIENLRAASRHQ